MKKFHLWVAASPRAREVQPTLPFPMACLIDFGLASLALGVGYFLAIILLDIYIPSYTPPTGLVSLVEP